MQPTFALDADTYNFLRGLGLFEQIRQLAVEQRIALHMTGYVAYHELNSLQVWIKTMEDEGSLCVHKLRTRSKAFEQFRTLKDHGRTRSGLRVDKGECELVAWLICEGQGVTLVSCDAGARDLAREHRIEVFDLCEFICELVRLGLITRETAAAQLAAWDSPHAGLGRPTDFPGFLKALEGWFARYSTDSPA